MMKSLPLYALFLTLCKHTCAVVITYHLQLHQLIQIAGGNVGFEYTSNLIVAANWSIHQYSFPFLMPHTSYVYQIALRNEFHQGLELHAQHLACLGEDR